jgi:hypothetical protein
MGCLTNSTLTIVKSPITSPPMRRTFYSGAGTNDLTYPTHPPSNNTSTWNTFDYSTDTERLRRWIQA